MKNIYLILLLPGFIFFAACTYAQSPGLIVRPGGGIGITPLNPDGNSYSTSSASAYINDDIAESEIPFKIVPPALGEPTGDLATGPSGGFSDIVKRVDGSGFYMHKDASNIYFRLRIGNIISGSKGYSVLIDTDGKMGSADPNYVAPSGNSPGNPGFEYEVVLETNFRVAVYAIDGTTTPGAPASFALSTYSQISVALSTDSNNPDYFYDWYVPLSTIGSPASVRMGITTVTSPSSALQGSRSDIYGINDAAYASTSAAWILVTNAQPSVNLASFTGVNATCTAAPVVNTSILAGSSVAVTGTWSRMESSKPGTATITLYKNGVIAGSTTVSSGNTWSITVPAIATGDVFYAKALASGESECLASASVIARGCLTPPAAPVMTCASLKGISGTMPTTLSGNTISIYQVPATNVSPFSNLVSTVSNLTYPLTTSFAYYTSTCLGGINNVTAGVYMIVTQNGSCTSAPVFVCINSGSSGIPPAPSLNALTVPAMYPSTTAITGTGAASGDVLRLFINEKYQTSITATGSSFSFTGVTLKAGDQVNIYSQTGAACITRSATFTVNCFLEAPSIKVNATGNLLSGAISIQGISSAPGASVQLYKGTSPSGIATGLPVTAGSNGSWSVTVPPLLSGETYYAIQTANGCTSVASALATVLSPAVCPSITGSYNEFSTSVSGTMPLSFTGTVRLYLDDVLIGSQSVSATTSWSIAAPANTLYYNGSLKATAQAAGGAESAGCGSSIVTCVSPLMPAVTPVLSNIAPGQAVTYAVSNVSAGAWYSILDNSGASFATSIFNSGTSGFNLSSKKFTSTGNYSLKVSADALTGCPSSERAISVNVNLTLPLLLLSFNGDYQNSHMTFHWSTTNEASVSHFELERSDNGYDFHKAASIPFRDNGSQIASFDYGIAEQLFNPVYFRLSIVDDNGSRQYSRAILLKPGRLTTGIVSVSPNPFSETTSITYVAENNSNLQCTITSAAGQLLSSVAKKAVKGVNTFPLQQLSLLQPGIYYLSITNQESREKNVLTLQKLK